MTGFRSFVLFLSLAAGVHVAAAVAIAPRLSGTSGGGERGEADRSLIAVAPSLGALAERWETSPKSLQIVPAALPRPNPVIAEPNLPKLLTAPRTNTAPEAVRSPLPPLPPEHPPEAAQAPALQDSLAALAPQPRMSSAPRMHSAETSVERPSPNLPRQIAFPQAPVTPSLDTAAPIPPDSGVAPSLRPVLRPQRLVSSPAATPAQPAREAAGQGGGTVAGQARRAATVAGATTAQRQQAMTAWGGRILSQIERAKRYPRGAGQGTAALRLKVFRNGRLQGVAITRSAGSAALDRAATDAVRRAGRFPPAPAALTEASYSFSMRVTFDR